MIKEIYKGYSISTGWNDKGMGYDFSIRRGEGAESFRSSEPYFYEENALAAARAAVDGMARRAKGE